MENELKQEHPQAEANSLKLCTLRLIFVHAKFELKWAGAVVLLYNNLTKINYLMNNLF